MAPLLKIDSFASCLRGDKKLHPTVVEKVRCFFPRLMETSNLAFLINHLVRAAISIDEGHVPITELAD